jgi:hypothetical protein
MWDIYRLDIGTSILEDEILDVYERHENKFGVLGFKPVKHRPVSRKMEQEILDFIHA